MTYGLVGVLGFGSWYFRNFGYNPIKFVGFEMNRSGRLKCFGI